MNGLGQSPARWLVAGLLVVEVAFFGVTAARWRSGTDAQSMVLRRLDASLPAGVSLTVESAVAAAQREATAWAPDAFLFAAGMQVDWPEDAAAKSSEIPGGGWILLTFASRQQRGDLGTQGATLSMMIDRASGLVIGERAGSWAGRPARRIDLTTYPISSTVALFASELTTGNAYRAECPQFRHLSRVSLVPALNAQNGYWVVTYEDERAAGRPEVEIRVDAASGQVTHVLDADPTTDPCAKH
jgi:hypothetical protein